MKLNKEKIEEIQKLRQEGKTQIELAFQFKVSLSTIKYWTNEITRNKTRELSKINYNKKSKEEKKKLYHSNREYQNKYQNDKYHNDSEFRKKHIQSVMKSTRKKRENGIRINNQD